MKEMMDRERLDQYISRYGLDRVLPDHLRPHLALFRFEPDEVLCRQGGEPHYLYVLVEGKIRIFTTSTEGKTLLVNFTTPLGIVGEIESFSGRENLNTVTAVSPVEAIGIHKRWIDRYAEDPVFLRFLLDTVTRKFYQKSMALSFNLLHPVEVRLASYLLSLSYEDERGSYTGVRLSTMKDTAQLIGTSYRHLNRVLRQFCTAGLIERKRGVIRITDRDGLWGAAAGNIYENGTGRGFDDRGYSDGFGGGSAR